MKNKMLKVIVLCFVLISFCGCYGKYVVDRIAFYNAQEHDPDLIGVWMRIQDGSENTYYREYRNDGKVYHHTKYSNGTIYISTDTIEYWYTKDGKQYYMKTRGKSMKPLENSWTYSFSEDKSLLYLVSSDQPWTRTTLPE